MSEPVVPAVEIVPPAAPEPAVVTPPAAPAPVPTVDPRDAELEKLREERDNYRQGMLNAKDKLKKSGIEEEPEPIDVVAIVDQRMNERVTPLETQIVKLQQERDELARALAANGATAQGGATAGQKIVEPDLPKLTPEEEALLARRGLSAKDVKTN